MGGGIKHAAKQRAPSSSQLVVIVLCGFCTGVLLGCLYYRTHMQQAAGSWNAQDAQANLQYATPTPSSGEGQLQHAATPRRQKFKVVKHSFIQAQDITDADTTVAASEAATHAAKHAASNAAQVGATNTDVAPVAQIVQPRQQLAGSKLGKHLPGDTVHSLYTSNGSPYQNFQGRIMYASYRLVQKMPGGERLTGFTRILHRTKNDDVVGEIPTFRADPLQPACDNWCDFPVSDRPNAVAQWLRAVEQDPTLLKGAWILMLETDYVWQKPFVVPGSAHDLSIPGEAFIYNYIDPAYPRVAPIIRQMCPQCDPKKTPRSGPAPVLMRPDDLRRATPDWERLTAWIEASKEAKDSLGWVREMYAWDAAVQLNNISLVHRGAPDSPLIVQPPADHVLGNACLFHYTWGAIFKDSNGTEVWKFDKRFYTSQDDALKVPLLPLPPTPWQDGAWTLQDGVPVTHDLHRIMSNEVSQMNAAIQLLPDLHQAVRPTL